ncbi:similar to Saccharomyces cerevisiae YBR288C APM3 Mu3-like subunit of the clathrin associated protein complex (AP-3) [Maudiozyma barnettii]|uniref:Similar to Saccharomyces cerevisiae YBR288C APM3 Mu3-like subunit of the clathrin associated protein complex (AP-3) n=1 Tax=Maudiozyma barnettii TaxID=61262 RepID=A0A8H2ZI23_9SACH|nr:Apm3p [Kazachstania barnettii]CAB4256404.1 similar to Saccharomyces cerevisiae YBR288C APM3 Mu3-like subunit of the clathrin associated protein complex (AP-3) [Kazachstania barnettii]CAD1785013.1 similar to Saccharomyces cerevisiae YBR288C APM3 Mu3-like subunit of the clathrin associated protein complex (AP-3) [Kazachstania barnettii]
MYISFYITDSKNGLIFQYLPSASAPTFSDLWVKIKSVTAESDLTLQNEVKIGKYLKASKYHSDINNLNYWCLISDQKNEKVSIMDSFVLLETIDNILMEYFDKDALTVKKLTNNYDRLTMIFNYIIDDGEPQMAGNLYSNRIKDVIPLQNDLTKFIHSTAKNLGNVVSNTAVTSATSRNRGSYNGRMFNNPSSSLSSSSSTIGNEEIVPWRSTKIGQHAKEEIYLDFEETVQLVYQKRHRHAKRGGTTTSLSQGYINSSINDSRMQLVHGNIHGYIKGNSLLNGTPVVELNLNNNGCDLGIPRFYDCVNCEDYMSDNEDKKLLNTKVKFLPPDGKFNLMEYSIGLNSKQQSNNNFGLISINFENNLGRNEDEFEITVNISGSSKVEKVKNLIVDLQFFESQIHEERTEPNEHSGKIKIIRNTHGRFSHDIDSVRGNWIFDVNTPTGTIAILRGCIENDDNDNLQKERNSTDEKEGLEQIVNKHTMTLQTINVKYEHEGQSVSGIKVNSIDVIKQPRSSLPSNIFKGVKYLSKMVDYEIREY